MNKQKQKNLLKEVMQADEKDGLYEAEKNKLRPCDCKDMATASKLNEQGVKYNDQSIEIKPNSVILEIGHTTIKIPMVIFKRFAEWYLEEQETI